MSKLADKIHQLRSQNKSYQQISQILQCSKSVICYHLGKNQKVKTRNRAKKLHPYLKKVYKFTSTTDIHDKYTIENQRTQRAISDKIRNFGKDIIGGKTVYKPATFGLSDVLDKFGEKPTCYLTGTPIDIHQPASYAFDHIIPRSRGGDNSLDNLGLCTSEVNHAKYNMTPDEFINLCNSVVKYNKTSGG